MFSLSGKEKALAEKFIADPYFTGDDITRRLYAGIGKLPPKQKIVFTMRYLDQMKFDEIASILKGTTGSVKASYHHAFIKMKQYLEEED